MTKYIILYIIILSGIYVYKINYKLKLKPTEINGMKKLRKEKADRNRLCRDLIHVFTWLAIWILAYDILGGIFNIITGHSFYRVFWETDQDEERYSTLWLFKLSFWVLVLNFLSYRIILNRSPKKLLIIIIRPFLWVISTIIK